MLARTPSPAIGCTRFSPYRQLPAACAKSRERTQFDRPGPPRHLPPWKSKTNFSASHAIRGYFRSGLHERTQFGPLCQDQDSIVFGKTKPIPCRRLPKPHERTQFPRSVPPPAALEKQSQFLLPPRKNQTNPCPKSDTTLSTGTFQPTSASTPATLVFPHAARQSL
jgi:hypothetical protein